MIAVCKETGKHWHEFPMQSSPAIENDHTRKERCSNNMDNMPVFLPLKTGSASKKNTKHVSLHAKYQVVKIAKIF